MSGFKTNDKENVSPIGSIYGYIGTSDPAGWVIADGQVRNNTSGIYNNISNMGIGSISGTNYTPPNYKGAFLRGVGTSPIDLLYSGAATVNTAQSMGIQPHSHTITDPGHDHATSQFAHNHSISETNGHTHGITDNGHSHVMAGTTTARRYNANASDDTPARSAAGETGTATTNVLLFNALAGITINDATSNVSINSGSTQITSTTNVITVTSGYNNTETRPFNYSVNWIIKI
jgi:hypothetical protein